MGDRIERLYKSVSEVAKTKTRTISPSSLTDLDRWMISRLQDHIQKTTEAMDKLAVRKAIHTVIYEIDHDFQWYQKRTSSQKPERKTVAEYVHKQVADAQVRMLAPIASHICEELWEMMGGKEFVSLTTWPSTDETKVNIKAEESETLVMNVLEDTQNITKATGVVPKRVCYYTAASWKRQAWLNALEKSASGKVKQKEMMKELMIKPELRAAGEKVSKFITQMLEELTRISEEGQKRLLQVKPIDEACALKDAKNFLEKELNAEVEIYDEEDPARYDPKARAQLAKPNRPAIFIE
jgi:leucyl-tRNA synthetase